MLLCLMGLLPQKLGAKTSTSSYVQTAVIARTDDEFTDTLPLSYLVHKAMLPKDANGCISGKNVGETVRTTVIQ